MKPKKRKLTVLKAMACVLPLAQAATLHSQVTNWIAYNDYLPSPQTAANVTGFDLWNGPGGSLINFADLSASGGLAAGVTVNVALGVASSGSIAAQGTMLEPAAGTPAYELFHGIVDMATGGGFNIPRAGGGQVVYTFTGLNPGMAYSFQATGARGRETDPTTDERWAKVALTDYSYLNDASTPGCTTLATYPAAAGSLAPGDAAFNVGRNATAGDVVGWNNIVVGAAGTLTVTLTQYTGPINKVDASGQPLFGNGAFAYSLQGFRLVEIASMPVSILADPAASTTLKQLDPLSLSVKAQGTGLQFQWYKGTTAVDGATSGTFALTAANPGDSGDYTVVVSNSINSRTSTVAHVTVNADTAPPQIVSSGVSPVDPYGAIRLAFDEILDNDTAVDLFNYTVKDAAQNTVSLGSAVLSSDRKVVTLTVDPNQGGTLSANATYQVTATGIKDRIPNTMPATTVPVTTWPLSRGFLRFDYFVGLDSGNNVLSATLLADPRYPYQPSRSYYPSAFDSRAVFPDDTHEGYGFHVTGFFVAPTNGDYMFFLKSDDSSQLYLNPAGPTASGKVLLTEETGCCGVFSGHASTPQTLVGGQMYYVEANLKEGTGGDYIQVAMKAASDATSADSLLPVSSAFLATSVSPAGAPTVTIVQQPVGATNPENARVNFSVTATNSTGASQFYVWRKNGIEIPLANASSYLTPPIQATDEGALFDVVIYVLGGSATSTAARLGVVIDVTKPTIDHVTMNSGLDQILITFSELVDPVTATDLLNYGVTDPNGPVVLDSVTLLGDGKTVAIKVPAGLAPNLSYSVSVSEVMDLKGNTIVAGSTAPVTALPLTAGFLKFEYFPGIGGNAVSDLTSHPSYINESPASIFYLSAFDSHTVFPNNTHETFGGRITGVFIPPTSGNWIFYLASDDASQLWLNPTGPSAAGKVLLTEETACCNPFAAHASAPQALTAGDSYFIQALYKEGTGGDFCKVAAKLDTDPTAPNSLQAIPGSQLGQFLDTTGASLAINQQPANQTVGRSNPAQAVGGEEFTSGTGGYLVVNGIEGGNVPAATEQWLYNSARGSWAANGGEGIKNTALNSPQLTVTTAGAVSVTFSHRYNFEADSVRWDGGQLRVSINRSPYATVPSTAITGENYKTDLAIGGNSPPIAGQFAFNAASPDFANGSFVQSTASLGNFNVGDSIGIQFIGCWDEGTVAAPAPAWEITSVQFSPALENRNADGPVTFTVAATASLASQTVPIAYQWQRNDGAGFVDIAGATSASLSFTPTSTDDGAVFRCRMISPGAAATSQTALLSVLPKLSVSVTGANLTIRWPDSAPPFALEQTGALLTPATTVWTPAGGTQSTVGGVTTATLPLPAAPTFYRLRR
jgi:hypothetical protein